MNDANNIWQTELLIFLFIGETTACTLHIRQSLATVVNFDILRKIVVDETMYVMSLHRQELLIMLV